MRTASPRPRVVVEPASSPAVTCIVVTYGSGPIVLRCLETLAATLRDDAIAFDVVVVDNEHRWAHSRTRRLLALATAGVRVIAPGRNLGFAGGNNVAVRDTTSELLAFVNPDIEFRPGWFPPLVAALDRATIASPVLLNADGTIQETGHLVAADGSTWPITDDVDDGAIVERPYASAACWVMRRGDFERLGGFDTTYHPAYYEDADLGLRAAVDGAGTVVVGASRVVHARGGSTTSSAPPDISAQRGVFRRRWASHLVTCPPPPG